MSSLTPYWNTPLKRKLAPRWTRFWLKHQRNPFLGPMARRMAVLFVPAFKPRMYLAKMSPVGFVEPTAQISHDDLRLGKHCFIGDRVVIHQRKGGRFVLLGDHVCLYRDTIIETGTGGYVGIEEHASLHPSCYISAFKSPIVIGKGVMLAPFCVLYSHSHGLEQNVPIREQPLTSNGPIIIEDEAWLGACVTVLSGVRIGKGAAVGAGSVVTKDIPDNAIAAGNPARVMRYRGA
jgi:acetyltransferase-like isoleucine patch superfamily enzyme